MCRLALLCLLLLPSLVASCAKSEVVSGTEKPTTAPADPAQSTPVPHVVFVTGDEEYRSEESMPMLARILEREFGFRTSVAYSLNEDGEIDPNRLDNVTGIEALADADLLVLFTRFRRWPAESMQHFLDYVESGRPVVGFRTATHAFAFPEGSPFEEWNQQRIRQLVGQRWITHHGHNKKPLRTAVTIRPEQQDHPILRGVEPFQCPSWLYHVEGGGDALAGDSVPLLQGRSLASNKTQNLKRYPLETPVAWTKTYAGATQTDGTVTRGRVFFTTLGHPYDFKEPSLRRLALNGMLWALGRESDIPADGVRPDTVGAYEPNDAGFGQKFKPHRRPGDL